MLQARWAVLGRVLMVLAVIRIALHGDFAAGK